MSAVKKIGGDKAIWIVVIALAIFSFLPVYSASSNFGANLIFSNIIKHVSIIFIGIMIMYSTHLFDYKYFKGLSLIALPLVIFLLFFASFQGNVIDGANANRWLNIPVLDISFQPSTLASIFLLIYLSNFLSKEKNKNLSLTKTFLLMWLPIILVVGLILPSNFSTAVLIFIMSTMIIFIAGYKLKHLTVLFFLFIFLISSFLLAVNKFPDIIGPKKDDICYATQNRQDAVKQLALESDLVIVIGSENSSNSNRLREIAERSGVKAYLIDSVGDLPAECLEGKKRIGLTSGASAPEHLVSEVIDTLTKKYGFKLQGNRTRTDEGISFRLPKGLR